MLIKIKYLSLCFILSGVTACSVVPFSGDGLGRSPHCDSLVGTWAGAKFYKSNLSTSEYKAEQRQDGSLSLEFLTTRANGEQLEEKYQGTWKCTKEGFSTHVQSNVNPSKAYRYKYRLHRLDAQYMIYQRYSDGQETDFYVAKRID